MSYVELETEKIVGAKKFSKEWYHEKGHIVYNKSQEGIKNNYRQWFYGYIALISVILGQFSLLFKWASLFFMGLSVHYFIFEEVWCWKYAINKMKGGKK